MEFLGEVILDILLEIFLGTINNKRAPRPLRGLLLSLLMLPLSALFFHLGFALIKTRPNLFGFFLTTLAGVFLVGWAIGILWIARTKSARIPSASAETILPASPDSEDIPNEFTQSEFGSPDNPELSPAVYPQADFHEQEKKR